MKLLIDECLTPYLAQAARERGIHAAHVVHLGLGGKSDRDLMRVIVAEDWTFLTRNAVDFRGKDGSGGLYAGVELHAGLICFIGEPIGRTAQIDMLHATLDMLQGDMPLNQRIEVEIEGTHILIARLHMPSSGSRGSWTAAVSSPPPG